MKEKNNNKQKVKYLSAKPAIPNTLSESDTTQTINSLVPVAEIINTSDHAYQSATIAFMTVGQTNKNVNPEFIYETKFTVSGSTWNLMNKCVSKEVNKKYKNNPWNINEEPGQYLYRKKHQFAKIIKIIKNTDNLKDFFLLQEIDCLTVPTFLQNVDDKKKYKELKEEFLKELKSSDWAIEITTKNTGVKKPFAILYNIHTLELREKGKSALNGHGFECEFEHIKTKNKIVLCNLHLDYNADYSEVIPDYQKAMVRENKCMIMGGDTNHAPNHKIVGLINNFNNVTNLEGDDSGQIITDKHNEKGVKKCFDGFFVSPNQNLAAKITEQLGEVFAYDDQREEFIIRPLNPATEYPAHCSHKSAPGQPWIRGGWQNFIDQTIMSNLMFSQKSASVLPPRKENLLEGFFATHSASKTNNSPVENAYISYIPNRHEHQKGYLALVFSSQELRDRFITEVWSSGTSKLLVRDKNQPVIVYVLTEFQHHKNNVQLKVEFDSQDECNKFNNYLFSQNQSLVSKHSVHPALYLPLKEFFDKRNKIHISLSSEFMNAEPPKKAIDI